MIYSGPKSFNAVSMQAAGNTHTTEARLLHSLLNHERVHLKAWRLGMTWVYCLRYINHPSVPSQGKHSSLAVDQDSRTMLKVLSLSIFSKAQLILYILFLYGPAHVILFPNIKQNVNNLQDILPLSFYIL